MWQKENISMWFQVLYWVVLLLIADAIYINKGVWVVKKMFNNAIYILMVKKEYPKYTLIKFLKIIVSISKPFLKFANFLFGTWK